MKISRKIHICIFVKNLPIPCLFTGCGLNFEIHLRKRHALVGDGRHPGGVCSTIPSEPGNGRYRLYGDIKIYLFITSHFLIKI